MIENLFDEEDGGIFGCLFEEEEKQEFFVSSSSSSLSNSNTNRIPTTKHVLRNESNFVGLENQYIFFYFFKCFVYILFIYKTQTI
jgi:hypothetical protein